MNSSLQKALVASMLVVGGAVSALGQGYDYDSHCIDPNNTAPYSKDFNRYYLDTPLWSAGLGVAGSVTWKECVPGGPGGSVPVAGRFEFGPGTQGSIQDDLRIQAKEYDVSPDNLEDFQYGQNHGYDQGGLVGPGLAASGSGWSYARIQIKGGSDFLFGGSAFEVAYTGASNRYMTATQVNGTTTVTLQIDVVGDASRFHWHIVNNGTAVANYGLEVGQWVYPIGGYSGELLGTGATPVDNYGDYLGYLNSNGYEQPYITMPGKKPRETEQAFLRSDTTQSFPPYADFTGGEFTFDPTTGNLTQKISPQLGGGMQVVLSPYQNVEDEQANSDQTPVDEFDLGDIVHLLDGAGIQGSPTFGNVLFNDVILSSDCAFTQKWYYAPTPVNGSDDIVTYYRSVWGDSNYYNGYTGVVDTPKALSADLSNPQAYSLNPNPFHIVVDVDNTGVFGYEYQQVNMDSVEVDLNLPPGMYPAGGSPTQTSMKQFISSGIVSRALGSVDFLVQADPSIFGPQSYTVTIKPSPGAIKIIKGTINVAATPRLQLVKGANLITEPWTFAQSSWESVLGLPAVTGFQAYNWDPLLQEYIPSSGPQREIGTWIVTDNPPVGFFNLGGSPQQPKDEFPPSTGASNLPLQKGWNLVANPYNYSFPLGQLVGAVAGSSQTYDTLVANNVIDGSFAYYDPNLQTYDYIGLDTDEMLPNHGYWLFCQQPVTLVFPPVYDLFVRSANHPTWKQYSNHWKFQISAAGAGVQDLNNYYVVDTNAAEANKMAYRKPPISAAHNAIRAFLTSASSNYTGNGSFQIGGGTNPPNQGGGRRPNVVPAYSQLSSSTPGKHIFNFNVFPTQSGAVTVKWPNLQTLPRNIGVHVQDLHTGQTVDARSQAGYVFESPALTSRTFQVTLTPEATVREEISNVSTQVLRQGGAKQMIVSYTTTTGGIANLAIYQNGKRVGTLATQQQIVAGKNTTVWGMMLSSGVSLKPGTYTLSISAVGDGGDVATKYTTLNL